MSREPEVREASEAEKLISSWRQSERKKMIETVEDLIQLSCKHVKSQYTQSAQRAKWTRLAGQLIWYKDQILKNYSLEALDRDIEELFAERNKEDKRKTPSYPMLVYPKPKPGKPKAEGPEGAKEHA